MAEIILTDDIAVLTAKNAESKQAFIEKFDEGYQTVVIVDSNDLYIATVLCTTFRNDMHYGSIRLFNDIFLNTTGDEGKDKKNILDMMRDRTRHEIPILSDGKIIKNAVKEAGIRGFSRKLLYDVLQLHWEAIDEDCIRGFLGNKSILLSSTKGIMSGFHKRLIELNINFSVYADNSDHKDYDIIVYGGDVWSACAKHIIAVSQLYVDMLAYELKNYLQEKHIRYFYFDIHSPVAKIEKMIEKRVSEYPEQQPKPVLRGGADYISATDCFFDGMTVIGDIRKTAHVPEGRNRQIHFFGPCVALGAYARDEKTIESRLQKKINSSGMDFAVVNHGGFGMGDAMDLSDTNTIHKMCDTFFHEGDIVMQMGQSLWKSQSGYRIKERYVNSEIFKRSDVKCFNDSYPGHVNDVGYEIMADFIFQLIVPLSEGVCDKVVDPFFTLKGLNGDIRNKELLDYIEMLQAYNKKANVNGKKGSIVMNANPFTLGHQYLVERALEQVDALYVFVVEEDKSVFSFKERFEIVKDNCRKYNNVIVIPSGKYIISALTFKEYFDKEELQDEIINPAQDISIFGGIIAPAANISVRFVGEEPNDNVTRQYNEAMKAMLPDYGIEVVEIKRKQHDDGKVISATEVRRLIKDNKIDECKALIPQETARYIWGY